MIYRMTVVLALIGIAWFMIAHITEARDTRKAAQYSVKALSWPTGTDIVQPPRTSTLLWALRDSMCVFGIPCDPPTIVAIVKDNPSRPSWIVGELVAPVLVEPISANTSPAGVYSWQGLVEFPKDTTRILTVTVTQRENSSQKLVVEIGPPS